MCGGRRADEGSGVQGDGREKTFFEVLVGDRYFIVECGFKCSGLAHVTLWLGVYIGFEWFEDLEAQQ